MRSGIGLTREFVAAIGPCDVQGALLCHVTVVPSAVFSMAPHSLHALPSGFHYVGGQVRECSPSAIRRSSAALIGECDSGAQHLGAGRGSHGLGSHVPLPATVEWPKLKTPVPPIHDVPHAFLGVHDERPRLGLVYRRAQLIVTGVAVVRSAVVAHGRVPSPSVCSTSFSLNRIALPPLTSEVFQRPTRALVAVAYARSTGLLLRQVGTAAHQGENKDGMTTEQEPEGRTLAGASPRN